MKQVYHSNSTTNVRLRAQINKGKAENFSAFSHHSKATPTGSNRYWRKRKKILLYKTIHNL